MKGDFTRSTFNPQKHFSRVLMQQGRVQLDADWNEQTAILLHYLQALAADLIGPHGGPQGAVGFEIGSSDDEEKGFLIGFGRYYVQGILCENDTLWDQSRRPIPVTYFSQADYPDPPELPGLPYLVYLDVWERHLTYLQDSEIREMALLGPDTCSRAKIVWQVKVQRGVQGCPNQDQWSDLVSGWQPRNRGWMRAGTKEFEVEPSTELCTIAPESRYRGAENQLYRVEIHTGGPAGEATFKWSRENGSVVFPILRLAGEEAFLEHLGRDERFSLLEGDWVEIIDDGIILRGDVPLIVRVKSIDRDRQVVALEVPKNAKLPVFNESSLSHPMLRRWDYQKLDPAQGYPEMADDGALALEEANWLVLEDGIQVYFEPGPDGAPHTYRTGDYWLIPARTATGDVEWPGLPNAPELRPPHGIQHAYAPLAIISNDQVVTDCRRELIQLWISPPERIDR
jgi:hypothetical protein